jgi:phosphate transport system substrate-binding protein
MSETSRVFPKWLGLMVVVFAGALGAGAGARAGGAQTAVKLAQVKKVHVGSLGDKKGAAELRDEMIKRLKGNQTVQVVATAADADAVLTGSGETWVKGYYSTSPRPTRYAQSAIYGGTLSVEVKGKDNETLWSYVVTPSKFSWSSVTQDLADQMVKKFVKALQDSSATGAAH